MNLQNKNILYIDLNKQTFEIKNDNDLKKYIGGVGLGIKILSDNQERDPIILSIGPLNGMFPYCSKASIVFLDNGVVEDLYVGGSLASRIKFTGFDSIVIFGNSKEPVTLDITSESVSFKPADTDLGALGLPGRRSIFFYDEEEKAFLVDKYFTPPENLFENKMLGKNVKSMVITGSKTLEIKHYEKYSDLYKRLLDESGIMLVEKNNFPSCVGCPMGCSKSKIGEIGGNVLTHSLVACSYAEKIFSDIGVVFSCLNILGYDYTHEDIEAFPSLVKKVMEKFN